MQAEVVDDDRHVGLMLDNTSQEPKQETEITAICASHEGQPPMPRDLRAHPASKHAKDPRLVMTNPAPQFTGSTVCPKLSVVDAGDARRGSMPIRLIPSTTSAGHCTAPGRYSTVTSD